MICNGAKSEMPKGDDGFSLIELLIVVAIILIIAAIAIPNLIRAKIAANEASATNSIRSINTAEFAYNSTYSNSGFALALGNLGGAAPCTPTAAAACLLDNVLSTATAGSNGKSGYIFAATGIPPVVGTSIRSFVTGASPINYNITGVRNFCSSEDGVIRFDPGSSGSLPVKTQAACQAFISMQ